MLRNPKYTGYNVWNRHDKRKGRPVVRPRSEWVWSPTPTHEAIVSKELFDQVEARAERNQNDPKRGQGTSARKGRTYVLRGRVRCGLCGRRMQGSHQKHNNWYRCLYSTDRGIAAADAAGHPRSLQVKEEVILEAVTDFLGRRIFGPERLGLLSAELAEATSASWRDHDAELERLTKEEDDVKRSLYRQTLRLEEHDDPEHPVVAVATRRIEELTRRLDAIGDAIATVRAQRPEGMHPDEIASMLEAVPDLRQAMREADDAELVEIFDAFDVTATYIKEGGRLEVAATVAPQLLDGEAEAALEGRSQERGHSGGGI